MTKFKGLLEATKIHRPETGEEGFLKWLPPKRGRPPGKRSHPDFEQITAYIRKDTHRAVKIALLKNDRKEFSELVEELVNQWLKSRI
jgi:FMN phosphatase YigB (HAD superfamily)